MTFDFRRIASLAALVSVPSFAAMAHPGHDHSKADHMVWEVPAPEPSAAIILLASIAVVSLIWLGVRGRKSEDE